MDEANRESTKPHKLIDSFQLRQEAHVQVVPHLQPVPATTVLGQLHGLHSQCSPHGHVEWLIFAPPSLFVHLY